MTRKLTRERLSDILEFGSGRLIKPISDEEIELMARMALAAMDSEPAAPVAEVVSIYGDPEAFGEREIRPLVGIQQMPYGTKLYRHTQTAPVVLKDHQIRELVNQLRDIAIKYHAAGQLREQIARVVRSAILAGAPQLPGSEPATVPGKWIPVSERMPIEFEAVIAFDGDQVYGEAMHSSDDGFTIDGYDPCDRVQLQNVTHWMPLPSAPQEVKGE
ncbi:hypothetical protein CWN23_20095 [Klebsiella pneumoniae]|nr:DUF551 domain-containing protein [Klebsiella pneumoniae]PLL18395.1 hypothetical protein CWN31_12735 [Klebsiella pneumoniae]PLM70087.1 hypothetical protein CWN23_20095 [Klebsiella pneumoniae]